MNTLLHSKKPGRKSSQPHFALVRFVVPYLAASLLAGCITAPSHDAAPVQDRSSGMASPQDGNVPRRGAAPRTDSTNWAELSRALENALRDVPNSRVERTPEGMRVLLPAANGFIAGKAGLTPVMASTLQQIVPVLNRYQSTHVRIVTHTDGIGSEMFNLRLSIQRAEAVMEQLRHDGISLARMSADGRGEIEPIADNSKPDGRARNRRVEIFLNPG
ncbi:MAG: OmpA family protein [Azoarcus sp.]|jgi:outer membrane protein OmpA-like peptidoglycan-associated protein|nr:OmpA family protein [Azoarcus sp.]